MVRMMGFIKMVVNNLIIVVFMFIKIFWVVFE